MYLAYTIVAARHFHIESLHLQQKKTKRRTTSYQLPMANRIIIRFNCYYLVNICSMVKQPISLHD